ncbi:MAG TPA: hypothetical protein VMT24_01940 [Aggregatilineaceae bacterium]|nr:hypothetical protein [Aggregatilineaceae bacterium]
MSHAFARHLTPYIVPSNATASVLLPGKGAEPVEVGSGAHRWSYAYRDPDAHQPLSIDDTIGEIGDDPRAWAVVMNSLAGLITENVFMATALQSQSKTTLRQGLAMLPNADELLTTIADALAELGPKS